MYGREYSGKTLNFEASGGLMHASLVMRDKETDSYWSIMTGNALAGDLEGTRLKELPYGSKVQWKDWVAQHPETLVLSVDDVEHASKNPYDNYFSSPDGFRGVQAEDDRLPTKESIYAFHLGDRVLAIPSSTFEEGGAFKVGGHHLFLYRPKDSAIFYSTIAFISDDGFEQRDGSWHHASGATFDPGQEIFVGGDVPRLNGFDTFWFNWSMSHPETEVLKPDGG